MPMCGLLAFILLDVLGASWFCILVSDIILGKFSFIIVSKISSVLSLFSFRFLQVYVAPFAIVPPSSYHLFLFFPVFFLLAFQFRRCILRYPQAQSLSSATCSNKPMRGILNFSHSVFDL